ncbi:LysR substrate-binding domain-containing protein [Herpetosiphon giganteus]|uniref:LysR substrate-binding domain-containing protein n=1 Tax=Herpetosiphon giganteus TaxID=2029754 RepID=UPI00195D0144|nr:LysR substrate-binding domain-containing protein [Herpetosiphon giganteus]MBM7844635.1 LysR family cyn operon transcriptional activator [Herpetosiphon giganteus]
MMELRQLRYLVAVVQAANFTRAAETLFISQSALSQQIQVLEQTVGTVLINRSKRGVSLTAAGSILYQHAERIFGELQQAETAIRELAGLQRGELTIGVVQTVNDYLIPALAASFANRHPRIKLLIEEAPADTIEQRLVAGELQLGLSFVPSSHELLASQALFEERLALIVRNDHPLASQQEVTVSTLDAMELVLLAKSFCTRRLWEESARLAPAQPQIVMELNTVSSILAVVERTGLPTVLPALSLNDRPTANLARIRLINPIPARKVGLLWQRDVYRCHATQAFSELVQTATAHLREA